MSHQDAAGSSASAHFRAGIDDAAILPLVAVGVAVKKVLKAALTLLIDLIDILFPILLQVMRFPLFTLRMMGDGLAALLKGLARILPIGGAKREAWREFVSRQWAWVRAKLSYRAFEEAVHHAFESGMAWVFRTCKSLTPRAALLVLIGAALWLPVSFGAATAIHAVLIAKATVLPAWMQLLHPVATVIAKSKLLVLPVYPAAWPQAKQHPVMQATIRFFLFVGRLHLARKTGYRFWQTERAADDAGEAMQRAAAAVGLTQFFGVLLGALNAAAAWTGRAVRVAATRTVEWLSMVPLLGAVVRRYAAHYEKAGRAPAEPLSERVSDFLARWSVKFTAEYYEAKEREAEAKGQAGV